VEKKKVEEEEAYRAKVREESQHRKSKIGCGGCLIGLLIIIVFFTIILLAVNPVKQFEKAEQSSIPATTSFSEGIVGKHAYNKINGTYRGEILEVKPCNSAPELTCYVVDQPSFMRPIEAPADNSIVKDEPPKP